MIQQHLYDAANTSTEDQLSLLLSLSMSPTWDPENCRLPNTRIIKPMSPVSECSFYCSLFIIVFKTESPVSWRGRLHTQSVAQQFWSVCMWVCLYLCVWGLLELFLKHRLHLSDYATFPFDFHKLFTAHRLCKEMGSWMCVCSLDPVRVFYMLYFVCRNCWLEGSL